MKIRMIKSESGLTLLEVMIAMLILGISLLLLLNMAMVALDANDWSNNTTVAVQAMQEKLEQLRTNPNPTTGSDTVHGIRRSWTVRSAGSHLREVSIEVGWENINSDLVTDSLRAYIKTDSV